MALTINPATIGPDLGMKNMDIEGQYTYSLTPNSQVGVLAPVQTLSYYW